MDLLKGVLDAAKAKARALAMNISEIELKVQEATNADPWGPHGSVMGEIAQAAEDSTNFGLIMGVIEQRIQESGDNWRLCYKALLLLEFLCRKGPLRVAEHLKGNITALEALRDDFQYKDPAGKDQGINIRQRAKELVTLISNHDKLLEEREKAVKNAGKYTGVSSAEVRSGMVAGGSGSNSGSNLAAIGSSSSTQPVPQVQAQAISAEDPFEATRKRIQQLKFEGALPDGPLQVNKPDEPAKKTIKKLSEVKVDPAIAARLGVVMPPPSSNGSSPAHNSKPAADPMDLFASLDSPAAPAAAVEDDWSGFSTAAATTISSPASAKKLTDIEAMLNLTGPAPVTSNAPLPLDAFSSFAPAPMMQAQPAAGGYGMGHMGAMPAYGMPHMAHQQQQQMFDPFAPTAAMPAASFDPFGASVTAPPTLAPTHARVDASKPKLGTATASVHGSAAKKSDPFSDLVVL